MKVKIENATASQLANYARVYHGIEVAHQKGKENILAMLANVGFDGDEIEVDGPQAVPGQTTSASLVGGANVQAATIAPTRGGKPRRMVKITILEQDIPGSSEGREPVPVSVNGSLMYIPRGKPVEIPYEFYHALDNARYRQFDTPPDQYSSLGESREVPRFPITVHHIDPESMAA